MVELKTVLYTKLPPKMVSLRNLAWNAEDEEENKEKERQIDV